MTWCLVEVLVLLLGTGYLILIWLYKKKKSLIGFSPYERGFSLAESLDIVFYCSSCYFLFDSCLMKRKQKKIIWIEIITSYYQNNKIFSAFWFSNMV